jgi:thiol-disulfide isomerase/thioredoxin
MKVNFRLNGTSNSKYFDNNSNYLNRLFYRCNLILITAILIYGCSKQNKASINARILNASKTMAYLVESDSVADKIIDSAIVKKNGKVRFYIPIENPGYYQLKFQGNKSLTLILSPGEKINLTSDLNDFYNTKKIDGSLNSIRVNYLHDSLRATTTRLNEIKVDYSEIVNSSNDTLRLKNLSDKYKNIVDTYHRFSIGYLLEDIKSLVNIAVLFQEYSPGEYVFNETRDIQYYRVISDTLKKYYPKVKQVSILSENYKTIYQNYQVKRMLLMAKASDNHLPDIKLADKNGSEISLSSLRGKTVLLSFWSVNNTDCIQSNAEIQKVYKKFRGRGFEIFQVSVDNSLDVWRKELTFEQIPWISVCDTAFVNSSARGYYNVNSIPLNYLLNPGQTELLGKNLTATELDQKLTLLLN